MKKKLRDWFKRYFPAEILGTIGAITGALLIYFITKNRLLSAYAGAIGENIGYYGFIITREYINDLKKFKNKKYRLKNFLKIIKNLFVEFGFSELLDSLIVRPFCMYIFPLIIGQFNLGIFIGKLVADVFFYIPTIIAYEFRKKYLK